MENDNDMTLLKAKAQVTCKDKKVNEEECINPLAWWTTHEIHFSYARFVAQQILNMVGSQIEAKRVFNIVNISTNL
jgi:hypothetical protein